MAAWSSICWVNNLWAAVSAARIQRRPQAARHQTPVARAASCRLARALGRVRGRGASGPPSGGRGQPPGGLRDGDGNRPRPPPRRRAAGGAPAGVGRGRRRRRHGRRQGRQPHAKAATASDRATAPRQSAPAGGLRPPAPGRPATRPDAGRPRAGGPAASHQPTPTAARAHGPGPDKAGPLRWGGGGRAGPVPARPAPDRPHTFFVPARHLWGRAGTTATGAAPPAGRFAPETAGGPRGPGAAAYEQGFTERGAADPVPGGGDGTDRSRGRPSRSCGGVGGKENGRGAFPGWTRLDEKKCGEDALPPRLPLQRIPDFPLFGVVVRNVFDAGQFHMLL